MGLNAQWSRPSAGNLGKGHLQEYLTWESDVKVWLISSEILNANESANCTIHEQLPR